MKGWKKQKKRPTNEILYEKSKEKSSSEKLENFNWRFSFSALAWAANNNTLSEYWRNIRRKQPLPGKKALAKTKGIPTDNIKKMIASIFDTMTSPRSGPNSEELTRLTFYRKISMAEENNISLPNNVIDIPRQKIMNLLEPLFYNCVAFFIRLVWHIGIQKHSYQLWKIFFISMGFKNFKHHFLIENIALLGMLIKYDEKKFIKRTSLKIAVEIFWKYLVFPFQSDKNYAI